MGGSLTLFFLLLLFVSPSIIRSSFVLDKSCSIEKACLLLIKVGDDYVIHSNSVSTDKSTQFLQFTITPINEKGWNVDIRTSLAKNIKIIMKDVEFSILQGRSTLYMSVNGKHERMADVTNREESGLKDIKFALYYEKELLPKFRAGIVTIQEINKNLNHDIKTQEYWSNVETMIKNKICDKSQIKNGCNKSKKCKKAVISSDKVSCSDSRFEVQVISGNETIIIDKLTCYDKKWLYKKNGLSRPFTLLSTDFVLCAPYASTTTTTRTPQTTESPTILPSTLPTTSEFIPTESSTKDIDSESITSEIPPIPRNESQTCKVDGLKERCGNGCTLKIDEKTANCSTKFWLDTGNSFLRHWLHVDAISCVEGRWRWKDDNEKEWKEIGKREVSCSAFALPQGTALFYGTLAGGSTGFIVIIVAVALFCVRRRSKTKSVEVSTPQQYSLRRTEREPSTVLGIPVDPTKAEHNTWNWPVEPDVSLKSVTGNKSDTKSEVPRREPTRDTQFIDVTYTTPTVGSEREASSR